MIGLDAVDTPRLLVALIAIVYESPFTKFDIRYNGGGMSRPIDIKLPFTPVIEYA